MESENSRAALPLGDAGWNGNPGVSVNNNSREPRTRLELMPESSTKPRGQASNPDELVPTS
jgi:hypothetical protein